MRTLFDNYPSTSSVYPFVVDLPEPRWRAPFLAGLPHLWFGFFIAVERLDGEILTSLPALTLFSASQVLAVILLVTSLVVGIYSQFQGHPLWTQSWSSYSLVMAAGLVGLLVRSLEIEFPIEQSWIFYLTLLFVLLRYTLLFRTTPLRALLWVLLIIPVSTLLLLDAIPDPLAASLVLLSGGLAALVAAVAVDSQRWGVCAVLALIANLLAAAASTYTRLVYIEAPSLPAGYTHQIVVEVALTSACLIALYFGPWLFWRAWQSARRYIL